MSASLRPGHLLSALGALLLGAALWMPWYGLHLPDSLLDGVPAGTTGPAGASGVSMTGPGAEFARGLFSAIERAISVDAWTAFSTADVLLALDAGVVLLAVVLVAAGSAAIDPARLSRLALAGGTGAAAVILAHVVKRPGPDEFVALRSGVWVGLAGACLVAAGGWMAGREPAAVPVAVPALGFGSVPPPARTEAPDV